MGFQILKAEQKVSDKNGVKAIYLRKKNTKFGIQYDNVDFVFGFVLTGQIRIFDENSIKQVVNENRWFAANSVENIVVDNADVLLIEMENYKPPLAIGEVEPHGRLKYIDGAYNSLLMSPPKKGDPCLNALYMAGKIDQTPHTHPSTRIGFILRGQVTVRIWDKEGEGANVTNELLLTQGDAWFMEQDTIHSFHTTETDDMCLFAFHPDSDFGPTDEEAPMINRTMIQGESSKGEIEPAKRRKEKVN